MSSDILSVGKKEQSFGKMIFFIMCIATLLGFSMTTTQSFLPNVMEMKGIPTFITGYAMSSTAILALIFGLLSAPLMSRLGTPLLMFLGMTIMLICHLSLEFVSESYGAIFLSRIIYGLGAGIFYPSALTFVKGMLQGENTVTLFGMYTSTIPGAFLIGPPFAEWYLKNYGSEGYFLASAVPGILSVLLLLGLWIKNRDLREDYKVTARYSEVLSKPTSWLPILCLVLAGSIWGYVISFLPYIATVRQISGSLFIVASTIGLFASRFIVVDRLRRFNDATVCAWAICLMAVSLLVMGWVQSSAAIAICGFIFGLSYAPTYPFISVWILRSFDKKLHHLVIALTNTIFNFCMYIAPLFVSFYTGVLGFGFGSYQSFLSLTALLFLGFGFAFRTFSR
ncbi:MAG: chloramphenicol resistance protein [Hyphomicrobiales bacterium]|nr:MAG: chloramphenicol resistance protein [Hyphomicrobiales bacterium]